MDPNALPLDFLMDFNELVMGVNECELIIMILLMYVNGCYWISMECR